MANEEKIQGSEAVSLMGKAWPEESGVEQPLRVIQPMVSAPGDAPYRKIDRRMLPFLLCGALLIGGSIYNLVNAAPPPAGPNTSSIWRGGEALPTDIISQTLAKEGHFPNPRLSFYERTFCTGDQTSVACQQGRPYHPLVELAESQGWSWDDWRDYWAEQRDNDGLRPIAQPRSPVRREELGRIR